MSLPNLKELSKLAKHCRKLGISTFTSSEFSFTLSPSDPISRVRRANKKPKTEFEEAIESQEYEIPGDMPKEEELLFWSSGGSPEAEESAAQ